MEFREIKLSKIDISSFNTRKDLEAGMEDSSLDDLASSIRDKGLLNPITVMKRDDGGYDLIAGQRRFLACRKIGWETIPAIVRDKLDDADAMILSLIENVHRADMNPIDKARAYEKIFEKYRNYDRVAEETGVSMQTVKRYLSLLRLTSSIQEKITTSEGFAGVSALSKLADTFSSPDDQESALEEIGGFKQSIQLEIIKRSEGNLEKLADLKAQAMEGAFNTRLCTEGLCFSLPSELKEEIKKMIDQGDAHSLKGLAQKLK
jgi:ParB family chromosome partitioning protein